MTISRLAAAIAATFISVLGVNVNAAQKIAPPLQSDVIFVSPNQALQSTINYSVSSSENNNEVGLGLRVHFDSSTLSFDNVSNVLQASLQPIGSVQDDVNNHDNDASTDKFFVVAWIDIAGNWPGDATSLPTALLTGNFTSAPNFSGATNIAFSASSTSGGAAFESSPQVICRKPEVSLSTAKTDYVEGESGTVTVSLDQALPESCGVVSVTLETSGTAVSGSDYQFNTDVTFLPTESSVPVTLTTVNNNVIEADKTLSVSFAAGANYEPSTTQDTSLALNIKSDDSSLSIAIADTSLAEGANTPTTTVTVTRTGNLDAAIDASYQLSGTAVQGQDFTLSNINGSVHFDAGQAQVTFTISLLDDNVAESDESVTITLQNNASYQLAATKAVTLTIKDADEMCIDIDGNGSVDALTDGITLARYLLDYRGAALIDNSLANDAQRTTPEDVQSHIETYLETGCYDIDGNNNLDGLTDGILLIRHLSNFQGATLVDGVLGQGATRTTGESVAGYIDSLRVE